MKHIRFSVRCMFPERVKTLNEQIYYNIDALHAAISNNVQITFRYFNWVLNFSASPRIQKQYRRDGAALPRQSVGTDVGQ